MKKIYNVRVVTNEYLVVTSVVDRGVESLFGNESIDGVRSKIN